MKNCTNFRDKMIHILVMAFMVMVASVDSQSSSACTGPMMRSFNSCVSFLAGGSNASSPTEACCNSLRDLMSNGQDCLCLIVTGGVPFRVPINRTLAMSLPKACRQSGVPVECKATASPVPAPGPRTPVADGPSTYPGLSPPSPTVPLIPQPLTPPSPISEGGQAPPQVPEGDVVPTMTPPGMRPTLSDAQPSHCALPSLLVAVFGAVLLMGC